jgi:maleylpyruvate isomerase
MTTDSDPPDGGASAEAGAAPGDQLSTVLGLLAHHTQQLLGDTIRLADEQWREPSRLPGWSRAHVATHLARQADALRRLTTGARRGEPGQMYPDAATRGAEIEAGAGRSGLELQIDLDTAASALGTDFDALAAADAWGTEVELRGGQRTPARLLPLARLNEVVLHHVDLDVGFEVTDVSAVAAGWLLEWCAFRLRTDDAFPRLTLHPDEDGVIEVGGAGGAVTVSGPADRLLGWLTGRGADDGLTGADGVRLPGFG